MITNSQKSKGHSSEYGPVNAWLAFQEAIFGFASSKKFIVVTDIANYYDSISYEHLRNILAELSLAREHALDLLIYILSCMLWQPDYMPRVPIGLPQSNLDAPRLLAHSFLFEIDDFLAHQKGIDFARYMDDMDIGTDSVPDARRILRDLDLALQTRQIRLNSGKTKILSEREARQHFKIRENMMLDKLVERMDAKISAKLSSAKEKGMVELAIRAGFRRGTFSFGNGEKVLKRCINLARQTHAEIGDVRFYEILSNWPSLRHSTLNWWQSGFKPEAKLQFITKLFVERRLVDDNAMTDVSAALVVARLPKNASVAKELSTILGVIDHTTPWGFYSKIWLLSKYGSSDDLMKTIESAVSLWVTQEHLSRLVAGMFPRFLVPKDLLKFQAIVQRAGNPWSASVLQFHLGLASGTHGYTAIKSFVAAKNSSLPNGVSHSKFLMLLTLLRNPDVAPTAAAYLKSIHGRALTDPYYSTL